MKSEITARPSGALTAFLTKRLAELSPRKSQKDIATEVGFKSPNFVSMIKKGEGKLPLEKVPAMAKALEVDPSFLLRLTLAEYMGGAVLSAFDSMFNTVVSKNEAEILNYLRQVCPGDPKLTEDMKRKINTAFAA